ncbi:hypothetical protein OC844_001733 [Tilletia horrida]|nr:hypothetical protein OC844_001733 [Tilletia horrida]
MDARGGSAGPSALSQADLLRHSTLHAYALSRTAALHAGLSHNASLAHLAAAHAQDALAALLHCAATQRALDGGAPEGGGRVGPPAVRPRVGWVGGGETAGPGAGSSSALRDAAAATGTTASDWRAAAQLAVPSYMALHNPACSSCGLPSIPGLTSTSAFPRTEERAYKKRRKSSKTDSAERVAADMLSARCLLCDGAVIPGHAASDPVLERAEREAAQRSKARFPSVKKRKALERQHASLATDSKMSKVSAMQAVKWDVIPSEAVPGRPEAGHDSPLLLLSKKAKTKSKPDASAGLPSPRAMMTPLSKASASAQPAMGLLSFPGLSSLAKPQPDKAPTPRTPAVAFGPSLTSSFSPSSISSKSSMGKRPDPISNPNLPGPASRSAALGLPPSASKKASISASTTTRPFPLSPLAPSSSSSTGSSAKERKKERAAALRGLLGAKAGQPGKGAEKEKKGGGGGLADFLSLL